MDKSSHYFWVNSELVDKSSRYFWVKESYFWVISSKKERKNYKYILTLHTRGHRDHPITIYTTLEKRSMQIFIQIIHIRGTTKQHRLHWAGSDQRESKVQIRGRVS